MEPDQSAGFIVDHFPTRTLRIACVTETYPPEVNGVSMTVARLVEGLHRRDHDVQLIRPKQEEPPAPATRIERFQEVLTRGLPIPRYPNLRMGLPSKRELMRLWSLQRPDVVHIATEGPLGWSALQAAQQLKLPVSSDFRTNFHAYSRHYGIGWLHKPIMAYLRKFHNRTQCTTVPTEALRLQLEQLGFRHLRVVARGVDTRHFHPQQRSEALRAQWGARPDDPVVLCVGRLAAEKNLDVLLRAFHTIEQQQPGAKLVLVGDGPLRQELQTRCPQAILSGPRHGVDLAAHYASADLFVFPSLSETFGNVTPEAMASGLPVVAFDYAAAAQLMRGGVSCGALVPCDDAAGFEKAVLALALDPARRRACGTEARRRAERQDWDGVLDRFEDVLANVIRQGCAPRGLPSPVRLRQPVL